MNKLFLIIPILLMGCAGSPYALWNMSVNDLSFQNPQTLCNAYYWSTHSAKKQNANIKKVLLNRKIVRKEYMDTVSANKIQRGMTEIELLCSWGVPLDINTSVGSWGTHKQWIYQNNNYVYTENGVITNWQQ